MTTPVRGRHRAAPHPRLTLVSWSASGLASVLVIASAMAVAGASPSPGPTAEPAGLAATGPFGTVPGVATAAAGSVPDPAGLPVLDGWARGATMMVRPTSGTLSPWHAIALREPGLDPTTATDLGEGDGDALLHLSTTGTFLIGVEGTVRPDGDAVEGAWWWRIAVPDRDRPDDEFGPPVPAIRLASGDDVQSLEQGSSCYVGTCGDIGGISPPDLLPTVRTIPGAPLSVSLADGSSVVAWSVSATPVGGTTSDAILLGSADDTETTKAWVSAPAEGDWVLTVSVTFDRERGSSDGYGRLIVGPAPDA